MKILNGILASLFIYFAIVQFNDPDPVLWVLVYVFTALVCIQGIMGRSRSYFLIVGMITFVALAATRFGGMIEWVQAGQQSEIFGEMTGDRPYVEETREFFGLIIALATVVFNWVLHRRLRKSASS